MQDMNEKNQTYAKRISDLEHDNVRLEEERRRLTDDPIYFEKVAREKMGIIKDGEVVYKIMGPGQKKNGLVSEESSFIIKSDTTVEKPKAAVKAKPVSKTTVKTKTPTKATAKTATKTVTKTSTKPVVKKDSKATKKTSSTVAKKKKVVVPPPKTTQSTNE